MANEKRAQARQLWEQSGGTLPLKDIAQKLGVSESTLRSWKARDGWGHVATSRAGEVQRATQRRRRASVNRKAAEAIEANEALSEAEKAFCAAFTHAPNGAQAAMATGRYSTYASAKQAAYAMLQQPVVREEIKRLKVIKHMTLLADGDDVIEMHMRIAFADITQFATFEGYRVTVKPSTEIDGSIVSEVKETQTGVSVKLVDRQKSLAFLERHFELNPMDRHKKDYDNRRLALEERKATEGNEDALSKLDEMLAGIDRVMQHGD